MSQVGGPWGHVVVLQRKICCRAVILVLQWIVIVLLVGGKDNYVQMSFGSVCNSWWVQSKESCMVSGLR